MKPNGYIIHETDQIVAIATGFSRNSNNPKTGAMIQTWILVKDVHPTQALLTGQDKLICGKCPLMGQNGKARACYVRMDAPAAVWKKYQRNGYTKLSSAEEISSAFIGRAVRLGSYGDPTLIPLTTIRTIASVATRFTGYTHQWHRPIFKAYSEFLMASCDSRDYLKAQSLGWRTFTVSRETLPAQIVCPASAERNHKLSCADCGLCSGNTRRNARSIQIAPHGYGKQFAA